MVPSVTVRGDVPPFCTPSCGLGQRGSHTLLSQPGATIDSGDCTSDMRIATCFLLLALSGLQAGELFHQSFPGSELPKDWAPGGRPHCWTVQDGVLQGECQPADDHGPWISTPLPMKNGTVEYDAKVDEGGYLLMLIDGDSAYGGQAHLLRIVLRPGTLHIQQDRGALASKAAQKKARDAAKAAGQPEPKPTPEQLADPSFYRVDKLATASQPALKPGAWVKVKLQLTGNEAKVWVNGAEAAHATGAVWDVAKSKLTFLVGQGKKGWVRDVRAVAE